MVTTIEQLREVKRKQFTLNLSNGFEFLMREVSAAEIEHLQQKCGESKIDASLELFRAACVAPKIDEETLKSLKENLPVSLFNELVEKTAEMLQLKPYPEAKKN